MKAYVYILKSLKTKEYYIGSSGDPQKRPMEHTSGKVFATKYKIPYVLAFSQLFESNESARKAEAKLKKWKRRDFIDKIISDGIIKSEIKGD
jgi:predicted GIY-YIG superfamily endonuclease